MDDLKKKAIATAAKEVLKRPYSQVSSGIPLDSWALRDRISSAVACCVATGGTMFSVWLWVWGYLGEHALFAWYWVLVAAALMAVIGFMQPGWTESFLGIANRNKD